MGRNWKRLVENKEESEPQECNCEVGRVVVTRDRKGWSGRLELERKTFYGKASAAAAKEKAITMETGQKRRSRKEEAQLDCGASCGSSLERKHRIGGHLQKGQR
ncbi:hypothetical protein H072_1434 [Dactylellina haptotyla CBS 200.50]|uniref:Uncharacterized protein n=1 Tax=Dactylellina haptotyla (strain CBS 200.50) TaxID=1284197 RepID=S8AUC4_DACHA|nr:hypothetical protein H072_1434 [Dactylellina haptotyla CBS 200.50]